MALGKKCSLLKSKRGAVSAAEEGLGFVRYTRALGRKRILISSIEATPLDSGFRTPSKKRCRESSMAVCDRSPLEVLPQDILIRILCGVEHEDLNQLFHVSKAIREATLIAKQSHFAYSTPTKTPAFRTSLVFDDSGDPEEIEAPHAPKRSRIARSRVSCKNLADISVALFASPRKELFVEDETRSHGEFFM